MKVNRKTILRTLLYFKARLGKTGLAQKSAGEEPPLRAELFSSDQMRLHGKALAVSHKLSFEPASDRLLMHLAENEAVLVEARNLLAEAVITNLRIAPAGEWLLDNVYLIEEQIRTARRHLPRGYSRELPRLLDGGSAGLPRVYDIALEIIAHGDGRVDLENLSSFVAAYQSVAILNIGELWAVPIMLRLALIENLSRLAALIATYRVERNLANSWADLMMDIVTKDPKSLILAVADLARSQPPMGSAFVAEFTRRLRDQGPELKLPLNWIEQQLFDSGQSIEELVRTETQHQAADQVSVSNSIGSLRLLSAMDWREFVETMSLVEQTLCEDPADVYGKMDFATRNRYRFIQGRLINANEESYYDLPGRSEEAASLYGHCVRAILNSRAYFDDGTPLGSANNPECQIDSIAQSWSVLSGAGDHARSRLAMDAVDERLVRRGQGIVQLLDPPFDTSALDPGYIKGYVPGVRENGGQYTHAAIWAAMAFARLGDNRRAWELFTMINLVNDGIEQPDKSIPLVDGHREHRVEVRVSVTGT